MTSTAISQVSLSITRPSSDNPEAIDIASLETFLFETPGEAKLAFDKRVKEMRSRLHGPTIVGEAECVGTRNDPYQSYTLNLTSGARATVERF